MAAFGNYYIDAPTLSGATAVFDDVEMTIPASDGYYSDNIVVRLQTAGVLGIVLSCDPCGFPCDTGIDSGLLTQGTYELLFSAGADIGCTIIYFDPAEIPDGIRVQYDGVTYNELTSPTYGYLASDNPNNYTFVGTEAFNCGIGNALDGGGYTGLNQYVFNGTTFDLVGTSGTITGTRDDVATTATAPGYCTVYIPKTNVAPEDMTIEMVGPCATTGFYVEINCPVELVGVPTSHPEPGPCLTEPLPNTYYNVPNRGGLLGYPEVNEFFVENSNGSTRVFPAADYVILSGDGNRYLIAVDINGVITSKTLCT